MLILSRKRHEKIMIGDNIIVQVMGEKDGNVRLGVTAPQDVPVHREEIYEQIKAQQARQTA